MSYGLLVRGPDNSIMYDIGDYSTRFVTQINMTLPAGQLATNYGMNINQTDYFATIVEGNDSTMEGILSTELTAIAVNGSVKLASMNGTVSYPRPVKIDVYKIR